MKKQTTTLAERIALTLSLITLAGLQAPAAQLTLAWDPPILNMDGSSLTNMTGYRVCHGTASGVYGSSLEVGLTAQATLSDLQDGTRHFIVVKAVNDLGLESDPSEEFVWDAPVPIAPTVIATHPANLSVAEPASAAFVVTATGDSLTYQWIRDGQNIPNATSASYILAATAAATDNGAKFLVVVSGDGGVVTSAVASLTVADTTLPVISGPATLRLTANVLGKVNLPDLTVDMVVSDNCTLPKSITLQQTPAAGTTILVGDTEVVITATDAAGNTSQHSVTVTVDPPARPRPPRNLHVVSQN